MPGVRDPFGNELPEFFGGHAGVRRHEDFADRLFAASQRAIDVALEQGSKRLLVFPLRMQRRERLDTIERKEKLEVERLLAPERAVVVEGGDALGGGHEVRRSFARHALDKRDDRLPGRAVVPGGQGIGGVPDRGEAHRRNECHGHGRGSE